MNVTIRAGTGATVGGRAPPERLAIHYRLCRSFAQDLVCLAKLLVLTL